MHVCIVCWHSAPSPLPSCPRCGEPEARCQWPELPWPLPGHKHLTLQAYHAAGGQGVVYRAFDSVQDKDVAVKLLARNLSEAAYEEEIDRFAREKAAMDFISHAASLPMFVDVYDFHRGSREAELDQAPAFLEMEYITWPTLGNVIRDEDRIPTNTVFLIALELAQALRIMSRRIIHNDIKPHNLFVDVKHDSVDLKVADFGIWVPDDDKVVTQVGGGHGIAGTIAYMSPEQSSGERWDSRSDIYAACCVVWQCYTGSRPFPSIKSNLPILDQLRERQRVTRDFPNRPSSMPPELYEVLRKGLQHDPKERHENANEFRSHLKEAYSSWKQRTDDERRSYLARLEGFAASIAAQRQQLSAYYLSYVELSEFTSDIEKTLGDLRDESTTGKFGRPKEGGDAEGETSDKFEPEVELLDLERIEGAIGKARALLANPEGTGIGASEVSGALTVDATGPTVSVRSLNDKVGASEVSGARTIDATGPTVNVRTPTDEAESAEAEADEAESDEDSAPSVRQKSVAEPEPPQESKGGGSSVVALIGIVAAAALIIYYFVFMSPKAGVETASRTADPVGAKSGSQPPAAGAKALAGSTTAPVASAASGGSDTGGSTTGAGESTGAGFGTGVGSTGGESTADGSGTGDGGTDDGASTGDGAGTSTGSGDGTTGPGSSPAEARKEQWLESALSASDQQQVYGRKARITVEPEGDYKLSFKTTTCTLIFGPDGNPERLKNCKNPGEDWWYLTKNIKLRCRKDRCTGRYEYFDDHEGGTDSLWLKIKKSAAEPDGPAKP